MTEQRPRPRAFFDRLTDLILAFFGVIVSATHLVLEPIWGIGIGDIIFQYWDFIRGTVSVLFHPFSVTRAGGRVRFVVLIGGGMLLWMGSAIYLHPSYSGSLFWENLLLTPVAIYMPRGVIGFIVTWMKVALYGTFFAFELLKGMFSPEIFRHALAVFVSLFISLRVATMYLADIFELEREQTAFSYIMQAAFGILYKKLTIKDGAVAPEDRESYITQIGGPGRVQVNIENLAVFEKITGEHRIIPPTFDKEDNTVPIESFERLREVIDLRDQTTVNIPFSVDGRTRDGIRILAKNIRYTFSVLRAGSPGEQLAFPAGGSGNPASARKQLFARKLSQTPDQKYPLTFNETAIGNLVYGRGTGDWTREIQTKIRIQLRNFISEKTLNEFLSNSEQPASASASSEQEIAFVPRPEITRIFQDTFFIKRAAQDGIQLHWIDIGTWTAFAPKIKDRYVEAWKTSVDNEIRRKRIEQDREQAAMEELLYQVRETPLLAFQKSVDANLDDEEVKIGLVQGYIGLLSTASDLISAEAGLEDEPSGSSTGNDAGRNALIRDQINTVINHLRSILRDNIERTEKGRYLKN
jgi:hypothetical protein